MESPSDRTKETHVVIVAGHLMVEASRRQAYLDGCVGVVEQARRAPGCAEFSISADLLDPGRIVILERWASRADAEAFRGSGPSQDQVEAIRSSAVAEYDVADVRPLT